MAVYRDPVVAPPEQGEHGWQTTRSDEWPRPPHVPCDFDEGIGSGEASSVRREEVHPGIQDFRGDTQTMACAGCLQGKQVKAASFQQPVHAGGGACAP